MQFSNDQTIFARSLHHLENDEFCFVVDPARPNWAATNEAGALLLRALESPKSVGELVRSYESALGNGHEPSAAWDEVTAFLAAAIEAQLLALEPAGDDVYQGRSQVLKPTRLEEFWVQINDFCNLTCSHCLVSSSPEGGRGLPDKTVRDAVGQALDLGAEMIGITGGEPFFREDIFDLYELVLSESHRSVTTLTNGTRLKGKVLERLKEIADDRVELRISLDGPTAEVNDRIRGNGSFKGAVRGIKNAQQTDCRVTVTMAINGINARYAEDMPKLLKELGVHRLHVLWPFQRGRALEESRDDLTPSVQQLIEGYRRIRDSAAKQGISFFTYASWKTRIDGAPGLKYDLANHCFSSLCLYTNGKVFPSPALTQHPELALGDISSTSLRDLWLDSDVARRFRDTTVIERPQCRECHYRFLCGGGDMDHVYNTSRMTHGTAGDLLGDDPYCDLYQAILLDAMSDWTAAAATEAGPHPPAGNREPPEILRRMGHRPNMPAQQLTDGEATLATLPST